MPFKNRITLERKEIQQSRDTHIHDHPCPNNPASARLSEAIAVLASGAFFGGAILAAKRHKRSIVGRFSSDEKNKKRSSSCTHCERV